MIILKEFLETEEWADLALGALKEGKSGIVYLSKDQEHLFFERIEASPIFALKEARDRLFHFRVMSLFLRLAQFPATPPLIASLLSTVTALYPQDPALADRLYNFIRFKSLEIPELSEK